MSFTTLPNHLADQARRARLLEIEARLTEHAFPPQLVIENTSWCNLTCIHCSHSELKRANRHMDRALWDRVVTEVGQVSPDCEVWPTFYGEALLLGNELWDRLDYAASVGCRNLVLNSNGTALGSKDNIDRVLASPLRRFILSLDGFKRETFEHIRRKAKWDRVYPAVTELCRRRKERGQQFPAIIAQFTVLPDNAAEAEAFRDYWHQQGAEVKIRPMLEWTATGSIRTSTITHGDDFRIACPWANNTMAIHQDGKVVTCAVDYEGMYTVGNVAESSVAECWSRLAANRAAHRAHRWAELPEICRGCGDWQTAGAEYDPLQVEGTRPFWFGNSTKD
jgi:radical SAM protein with 4Fe4S-binding SPASM domain